MQRERGFSLIELLIVVAIILIVAAIAIPNLMSSRMAANEASAVASIRTINTAEMTYQMTYPQRGYTCLLTRLGPPPAGTPPSLAAAGLIDDALASGQKSGYQITLGNCGVLPHTQYGVDAVPVQFAQTGKRAFCSDHNNVIYFSTDGSASSCFANNTPIQ